MGRLRKKGEQQVKPSIWTDAFVECSAEEAVERLAAIGWKYLELADAHWRNVDGRESAGRDFKALKNLIEKLGISVLQLHGPMFDACGQAAEVRQGIAEAKRALRWAGVLGVRWVVLHPGSASMAEDQQAFEHVCLQNLRVVRKLAATAKKWRVAIALENLCDGNGPGRRVFGSVPSELMWLAEQSDPSRVGICWDTGHANIQRLDQGRALRALRNRLVATHIADNDSSGDQHLLPFEGTIDWAAVVGSLRALRFSGLFNLEVGGSVHKVPLALRNATLRYALELSEAMVSGRFFAEH